MLQREALEILKTGSNVFLTGVPGAGKTYVINKYVEWLKDKGIFPAITASTGIAATHIGGRTLHSFIGIGVVDYLDQDVIEQIMQREKLYKKLVDTKVLIIDEISMLDAKVLDKVNVILKAVKKSEKAFGGIQMIFVGDFFQLPPVTKRGEATKYFAFMSSAWKEARPLTCYLEEQFRQTDETFTKLLMAIRENNIDEFHVEILEDLKKKTFEKFGWELPKEKNESEWEEEEIILEKKVEVKKEKALETQEEQDILELHSHNKNVDEINEGKLNSLDGKVFTYNMFTQGRASLVENLIKSCLSPETLKLKVGAKVIFTKNDMEGKYVNGTMGIVQDLDKDGIVIETTSGKLIDAKQEEWKYEDEGKVKAKIMQYPLRLAWAITVHKSQGMSLDEAIINLGETFEFGQGYVALSRLRSLEGLFLKSYNPKSLQVNSIISEFDEKIRKDSRFIQDKFKKSQKEEKEKIENLQKIFVEKCGGIWEGGVKGEVQNGVDKKPTIEITLDLIKEGKSLGEIAELRDIKQESISKHVEELFEKEKLTKNDLEKIQPSGVKVFNIPNDIKKSFKKNKLKVDEEGKIKLSSVFHDLKEKYTYEQLRWYRMVID
jgi:ATP-dependent DNA helicase PIF1